MTETNTSTKNIGLRGVKVADTRMAAMSTARGASLIYRGFRIEELAENSTFEETANLLLHDRLPNGESLIVQEGPRRGADRSRLRAGSAPAAAESVCAHGCPAGVDPAARHGRPRPRRRFPGGEPSEGRPGHLRVPAVIAAWHRIRNGQDVLPPDGSLSATGNFLWQLRGRNRRGRWRRHLIRPHPARDHSFNASTFACREVVSNRRTCTPAWRPASARCRAACTAARNAQVMKMLEARRTSQMSGLGAEAAR